MAITEKYVSSAGGGAHDGSSAADAFSWTEMVTDINAGGKAGNRYNVIGSISRTTNTDTVTGDGSSTSPIIIRGYASTIADGYQGRTNNNGPLVTTNFASLSYTTGRWNGAGADWIIYENLNVTAATTTTAGLSTGANCAVVHCAITNTSTNASSIGFTTGATQTVIFDNDISHSGASGGSAALVANHADTRIIANRITGGTAKGITSNTRVQIVDNTIFSSAGNNIELTGTSALTGLIYGNTSVGSGADGVDIVTGTTVLVAVANNLFTDNGAYGADGVSAANGVFFAANRFDRNTSGGINSATDWAAATSYHHNTTSETQSNEYENYASKDFRLKSGSPAKAAGRLPFRDIGAVQREEPTGGAGGLIINPGMSGGLRG